MPLLLDKGGVVLVLNSIDSISKVFTFFSSICAVILIILDIFWKEDCHKKYKISRSYFTIKNRNTILFFVFYIIIFTPVVVYTIGNLYSDYNKGIEFSKVDVNDIVNKDLIEENIKSAFLIDGNERKEYSYDLKNSILHPKKYSGEKYRLFEIEANTYLTCKEKNDSNINFNNIKRIDKTEDKTKNAKSKYITFDFNGGTKRGEKAESICIEISNNASISTAIKFIEFEKLTDGITNGDKKFAYWSIDNNSYKAFEESNVENIKDDTLYAVYALSSADYLMHNNSLERTEFEQKTINFLSTALIALYMLVISIAIYLRVSNILKKNNNIKFCKYTLYIYSIVCLATFIKGLRMFIKYRDDLNNCSMWKFLILSVAVLITLSKFIRCKNKCISVKIKKIIISILVILINICAFYYVICVLDIILYSIFDIYIVPTDNSMLSISTINIFLGLIIILASLFYIIINIFIEKQFENKILLKVDNSKYKIGAPKDLAVICEYKNKFLSVKYDIYDDNKIKLYTDRYWFIDPSDCTIREESFEEETTVKEDNTEDISSGYTFKELIKAMDDFHNAITYIAIK